MEEVQQLMDFLMQRHASDYIKKIVFASSPLILSHFSLSLFSHRQLMYIS